MNVVYRLTRSLFPLALLLSLCLGACSSATSNKVSQVHLPTAGQPILIGGTLGLTGPYADPAADYQVVSTHWAQQINAHGGLLGHPVKLVLYNDEGQSALAQQLYQRLLFEDHVHLLLAPFSTALGGAVLPLVESQHMVWWNGGFAGISLFEHSHWMIGSYTYQEPDYSRSLFEMVAALPASQRPQRVGIVTEQNPFTQVVRDGYAGKGGALAFARAHGLSVVLDEAYPSNVTDVGGLIARAKAAHVDLFLTLSLPNSAAQLARAAQAQGFTPRFYCACGSQVTSLPYWKQLGSAGEGIYSTAMAVPGEGTPGMEETLALLKRTRGSTTLSQYAVAALSILQVLQEAVDGSKRLDQASLRAYVLSHSFPTITGLVHYDQYGMPAYHGLLVQYQQGDNRVAWPVPPVIMSRMTF